MAAAGLRLRDAAVKAYHRTKLLRNVYFNPPGLAGWSNCAQLVEQLQFALQANKITASGLRES